MTDEHDIVDVHKAAQFLGLHKDTLRRLARKNRVPAFKVGGVWRFRKSTLTQWAESQRQRPRGKTVLIVDDEAFIRDVVGQHVQEAGYRVLAASGGAEALLIMRHDPPDVVLLDLKMPEMDGPTTLKEIRKAHGAIPVIIVTGYPESDLMTETLDYCPVTLLAKPLDLELVVETVGRVLKGSASAQQGGQQ